MFRRFDEQRRVKVLPSMAPLCRESSIILPTRVRLPWPTWNSGGTQRSESETAASPCFHSARSE